LNAPYKLLAIHLLRAVAALAFVWAGANHFIDPPFYQKIIPPEFPKPAALVIISGVFEIIGGIGLLVAPLRRLAGCGLIALLIAVFPANIYMALHPELFRDILEPWTQRLHVSLGTILWIRLPCQVVFIAWVWIVAVGHRKRGNGSFM
jgi:uncharacterized membrane protein